MSSKHLFPNADGLVTKSLQGLISYNSSLALIPNDRVVFNTNHSSNKVSIISGGGGGHEPAWCGYVGNNMLAAAASGDIFASPSARQVLSAIKSAPSDAGTVLVITNYTGDCLHFGMACEKANATGFQKGKVAVLTCGDDVSVGKGNGLVGRRGLPGQILVCKVLGAAAEAGLSFEEVLDLGNALKDQLASIAATLDHCHVPGRTEHFQLDSTVIEIGTGPHNEPGHMKISPQPSPEELVRLLVKYMTDESDPQRGYVTFDTEDEVALLINNFGGMSVLEMGALTAEFLDQLPSHITPVRVYSGMFETSLNAPAFALTICNLTKAAKACKMSVPRLLEFLDAKTDTLWEAVAGSQTHRDARHARIVASQLSSQKEIIQSKGPKVDPEMLDRALRRACNRVVDVEPDLTRWDTIMGDGDCGETFKSGALELLRELDNGLANSGSISDVLSAIAEITETKMGGTLGAILSLFFNAFIVELGQTESVTEAPAAACKTLEGYTMARVGHRTIMDVIIPATDALKRTGNLKEALKAARKGAESTRTAKPMLGRATYVGTKEGIELPPDPGAWGAMVILEGL
ncbi:Dak1 domain-containing protein, partial [Xylogone sp. PMI_703]